MLRRNPPSYDPMGRASPAIKQSWPASTVATATKPAHNTPLSDRRIDADDLQHRTEGHVLQLVFQLDPKRAQPESTGAATFIRSTPGGLQSNRSDVRRLVFFAVGDKVRVTVGSQKLLDLRNQPLVCEIAQEADLAR